MRSAGSKRDEWPVSRHGRARAAVTADESVRALDSDACPVPILEVQCADAGADPPWYELALVKRFASVTRPVPIRALQWGALETVDVFVAVPVEALREVRSEAWPVPIAVVQ
jgi:hypothetical protein